MAWLFAMDTIWHWLVAAHLVLVPLLSVPTLQKAGWKGWWFFLWYVPLVNVVFLWVFAFAKWPNEPVQATD
jgi:hypothetical protein